jgi:hypothetical protein
MNYLKSVIGVLRRHKDFLRNKVKRSETYSIAKVGGCPICFVLEEISTIHTYVGANNGLSVMILSSG